MEDKSKSDLIQNVEDAGCSPKVVEEFLSCCGTKKTKEQLRLLSCQRQKLLDNVHKCEKQIGCLDYLVYKLKRDESDNNENKSDEVDI